MTRFLSGEGTDTTEDDHAAKINNKAADARDTPKNDLFLIFDRLLFVITIKIKSLNAHSVKRDAFDSQAQSSGGDLGLDDLADLLAHQGGPDRGFERNLASLEIHLVGADYLEFHPGICREVREFDTAQKANPVFGEIVGVDHARMLQDLLKETDTADGLRLGPPCFAISGIIAPVTLCASFRKVLRDLGINHVYKVAQFSRDFVVSLL